MTTASAINCGTPRIIISHCGVQGPPGPTTYINSAYVTWLELGNEGTEEEFLEWLSGQDGEDGEDGLSAYQIWINAGNEGTEADYLASLVGPQGEEGPQGPAGTPGTNGTDGVDANDTLEIFETSGNTNLHLDHHTNMVEVNTALGACSYILTAAANATLPIGAIIHLCQVGANPLTVAIETGSGITIKHGASFDPILMEAEAIAVLIKKSATVWRLGGALKAAA